MVDLYMFKDIQMHSLFDNITNKQHIGLLHFVSLFLYKFKLNIFFSFF